MPSEVRACGVARAAEVLLTIGRVKRDADEQRHNGQEDDASKKVHA
jgi:hypothetical protein